MSISDHVRNKTHSLAYQAKHYIAYYYVWTKPCINIFVSCVYVVQITHNLNDPCMSQVCDTHLTYLGHTCDMHTTDTNMCRKTTHIYTSVRCFTHAWLKYTECNTCAH